MAEPTIDAQIEQVAEILVKSKSVTVFTGAGMSVESGIPDFRSEGGLWSKFDPNVCASYQQFMKDPKPFWDMSKAVSEILSKAFPNPGHKGFATLEKYGKVKAIITQNIDGLHQAAGSKVVYEVHGHAKTGTCLNCSQKYTADEVKAFFTKSLPPACIKCGSNKVKTDVIMFGEGLPDDILSNAIISCKTCDVLIMTGSSLTVTPANMLPLTAKKAGAKVIFLNKDPTDMDHIADIIIRGKIGEIMPKIIASYDKIAGTGEDKKTTKEEGENKKDETKKEEGKPTTKIEGDDDAVESLEKDMSNLKV